MSTLDDKKVVIIGAGTGGLAVAALLARAGCNVDIYESQASVGGRMGVYKADGFTFDTGPSWYLMPEVYEHFFNMVGKTAADYLELVKLDPAYQVFFENETLPLVITGDEQVDGQSFEARQPGAAKALTSYLDSAEKTYKLSLDYFLYHDFSHMTKLAKLTIFKQVPAMLRTATMSIDTFVSKYFSDPGLRQVMEYPAVFLGSSPFTAPALYHLMSYLDFRQGVFYPKGGMHSVTQALQTIATTAGVTIHTNAAVDTIAIVAGRTVGVVLKSGEQIAADIVISNADLHHTQTKMLPKNAQDYPAKYWDKREAGPSALLMYLGVKGELPQLQHHNLFFTSDWQKNFAAIFGKQKAWPEQASLYVCKPSATDSGVAPQGSENIFVLVPLPASLDIAPEQLEKYADGYIAQIAEQAGIPDFAERIISKKLYGPQDFATDLNAWNGTALGLSHTLQQSALFRPRTKSKKVKNLYFVGANAQPGIGVPMCLISAELIYKDLLGDRSLGPMKVTT